MKRWISFLLVLVLSIFCAGIVPVSVGAETAYTASNAVAYPQSEYPWGTYVYGNKTISATACGILSCVNSVNYLNGLFDTKAKANTAIKNIAGYAYEIDAFNGSVGGGTARYYLFGTDLSSVPPFQTQFGETYGFTMPVYWTEKWNGENHYNNREYNNIYVNTQTELKNYLMGDCVAICHVPGHFICLADYDPYTDQFLVLDSAPAVKRGNFLQPVKWFSADDLSGGNGAMTVGGFCVIQSTMNVDPKLVYPYQYSQDMMLYDGEALTGVSGEGNTTVALDIKDKTQGNSSLYMFCNQPTANADMGGGVSQTLLEPTDLTSYSYITYSVYLPRNMDGVHRFRVELSDGEGKGYYGVADVSNFPQGWHTFAMDTSLLTPVEAGGDLTGVEHLRYVWLNEGKIEEKVALKLDYVRATNILPGAANLIPNAYPYKDGDRFMLYDGEQTAPVKGLGATQFTQVAEKTQGYNGLQLIFGEATEEKKQGVEIPLGGQANLFLYDRVEMAVYLPEGTDMEHGWELTLFTREGNKMTGMMEPHIWQAGWNTVTFSVNNWQKTDDNVCGLQLTWQNDQGTAPQSVILDEIRLCPAPYGDLDLNEDISAADALQILKSVVGKAILSPRQQRLADTNGDGTIGAADALCILQYVVGKLTVFPATKFF